MIEKFVFGVDSDGQMVVVTGECEGDLDLDGHIDKFFAYKFTGIAICRGIIDVVVVEMEGVTDVNVDDDVGPM